MMLKRSKIAKKYVYVQNKPEMKRIFINSKHHFQILQKNENSLLTNRYRCVIIIKRAREREIWRNSSAGQSNRFIPDRSWVRIQLPLPITAVTTRQWPVGQAAKTPPFHGGNTSSILVRVTKKIKLRWGFIFLFKFVSF